MVSFRSNGIVNLSIFPARFRIFLSLWLAKDRVGYAAICSLLIGVYGDNVIS